LNHANQPLFSLLVCACAAKENNKTTAGVTKKFLRIGF
jgi:hypothetical protein